jgi:hypothetical protein
MSKGGFGLGFFSTPGSGDGVPLGEGTIWPAVSEWAGLAAISAPRAGDRATVSDLGTGNAHGVAQYDGAAWQLVYGMFNNVPDLLAFTEPIVVGALAGVEQSSSDDETATRYQWNGISWDRTPYGLSYVWPAVGEWADLNDIPGPLRNGDLSFVIDMDGSGSSGFVTYNDYSEEWQLFIGIFATVESMLDFPYSAVQEAQAIVAGNTYIWYTFNPEDTPDDIERSEWLPPQIASRSPVLRQYATGAEADTNAIESQGNIIGTSGTATTTASMTNGFVRLVRSGGNSGSRYLAPSGVSATAGLGYYVRCLARADVSSGGGGRYAGLIFLGDGTNITLIGQPSGSQLGYMDGAANATTVGADEPRSALAGTSSNPEVVEVVDQGRTRQSQIWRNGRLISASRRNVTTSATAFISGPIVAGLNGDVTLDVRRFIGVEFTP